MKYPFDYLTVTRDGNDLVCRNAVATWFGSPDDEEDNGLSASGVNLHENPGYLGVALPIRCSSKVLGGLFADSPIPHLKWGTRVRVYSPTTKKYVTAKLVDLGPHPRTRHAIDLTVATLEKLGLDKKDGVYKVDFRIINCFPDS